MSVLNPTECILRNSYDKFYYISPQLKYIYIDHLNNKEAFWTQECDGMAQLHECLAQSQLPALSTDLPELPNSRELPVSSEAGSLNYQVN